MEAAPFRKPPRSFASQLDDDDSERKVGRRKSPTRAARVKRMLLDNNVVRAEFRDPVRCRDVGLFCRIRDKSRVAVTLVVRKHDPAALGVKVDAVAAVSGLENSRLDAACCFDFHLLTYRC